MEKNREENLNRHMEQLQDRLNWEHGLSGATMRVDEIEGEEWSDNGEIGKKDDQGKQQWYAMPLCVLRDLADAFNHGVLRYGLFNCLNEFDRPAERFWDSMMRHLEDCQINPLAKDKESGCYHAACVAFNALMYLYHCKRSVNDSANR